MVFTTFLGVGVGYSVHFIYRVLGSMKCCILFYSEDHCIHFIYFVLVFGRKGSTSRVGFLFKSLFKKNINLLILKFRDYWGTVEIPGSMNEVKGE